jgi:hypothetical protein
MWQHSLLGLRVAAALVDVALLCGLFILQGLATGTADGTSDLDPLIVDSKVTTRAVLAEINDRNIGFGGGAYPPESASSCPAPASGSGAAA